MRLKFRGREMAHTDIGFVVMKRAIAELEGMGHADSEPKLNGRQINVMLTPHPANKRKPRWLDADAPKKSAESDESPAPKASKSASDSSTSE